MIYTNGAAPSVVTIAGSNFVDTGSIAFVVEEWTDYQIAAVFVNASTVT